MTSDLDKRLAQHEHGIFENAYTAARLPIKLEWIEPHSSSWVCRGREIQIKKWSRKKKEALINGDTSELVACAKKDFEDYYRRQDVDRRLE